MIPDAASRQVADPPTTGSSFMIQLSILRMAVASAAFVLLSGNPGHAAPRKTLQAFANEQEITDLFKLWAAERRDRLERQRSANQPAPAAPLSGMADMMAAPAAKAEAGLAKEQDSITNVQHAGVDEGGIVKLPRRLPRHPAPRPALHRAASATTTRAGVGRRRVRPRHRSARRVVRRDADLRQHDRRDRLQLRARRHRDRAVRHLARRAGSPTARPTTCARTTTTRRATTRAG